ncbi:hypothetical protein SLA2020_470820 [Shorea laevis]
MKMRGKANESAIEQQPDMRCKGVKAELTKDSGTGASQQIRQSNGQNIVEIRVHQISSTAYAGRTCSNENCIGFFGERQQCAPQGQFS